MNSTNYHQVDEAEAFTSEIQLLLRVALNEKNDDDNSLPAIGVADDEDER